MENTFCVLRVVSTSIVGRMPFVAQRISIGRTDRIAKCFLFGAHTIGKTIDSLVKLNSSERKSKCTKTTQARAHGRTAYTKRLTFYCFSFSFV